jgi:hypothetical protein
MTDNVDVQAMQRIAQQMLEEAQATRAEVSGLRSVIATKEDITNVLHRLDDFRIRTELHLEAIERRLDVTDQLVISVARRVERASMSEE